MANSPQNVWQSLKNPESSRTCKMTGLGRYGKAHKKCSSAVGYHAGCWRVQVLLRPKPQCCQCWSAPVRNSYVGYVVALSVGGGHDYHGAGLQCREGYGGTSRHPVFRARRPVMRRAVTWWGVVVLGFLASAVLETRAQGFKQIGWFNILQLGTA